jgi:pimeloyl-ACP methyl ester carboxylesterase
VLRQRRHYAADVAAVVEHLDLRDAIHVGHATGGGVVPARHAGAPLPTTIPPRSFVNPDQATSRRGIRRLPRLGRSWRDLLGWGRKLKPVGAEAKKAKQEINTGWIYPPRAERAAALASADPKHVTEL